MIEEWFKTPIHIGNATNFKNLQKEISSCTSQIDFKKHPDWGGQNHSLSSPNFDQNIITKFNLTQLKNEIETQVINVSTFQGQDGSAEIITKGGVPPFKYTWSNGATVKDLTNLRKGSYTIVVVDAVGQKKTAQIDIKEPELTETKTIHFPAVQFEFNRWSFINDSNFNCSLDS